MTFKMKELEARTGVNREAIRFYIREGLLPEPEKPKRNVALYSEEHVTRTKLIKDLQDKHFLPLKVVKAVLDSPQAMSIAESRQGPGMSHFLPALLQDTDPGPDRPVAEIAQSSGLSATQIEALAEVGAVTISAEGHIDFRDAAIINTWGQAQARGFDATHDYDADYFSHYVKAMKQLAQFETTRFLSNFGSSLDGRTAGELAADGIDMVNRLFALLHTKFVLEAVSEQTADGAERQRSLPQSSIRESVTESR